MYVIYGFILFTITAYNESPTLDTENEYQKTSANSVSDVLEAEENQSSKMELSVAETSNKESSSSLNHNFSEFAVVESSTLPSMSWLKAFVL